MIAPADGEPRAHLYAFDRYSGAVRWQRPFAGGVPVDVLRDGDTVYALTMPGDMVALDLAGGAVRWSFTGGARNPQRPPGSPALAKGRVVFASRPGEVYAVDAATGRLLWKRVLGGELNTSVTVVDGGVYVGSLGGQVHRLNLETGALESSFDAGAPLFGNLIASGAGILALAAPGTLLHLEPGLRTVRWRWQGASQWSSFRPLIWKETILLGNEAKELVAIRLVDGTTAWRTPASAVVRGLGLSPDGEMLFAGTLAGAVRALPMAALEAPTAPAHVEPRP